jgi:hypothetical protein
VAHCLFLMTKTRWAGQFLTFVAARCTVYRGSCFVLPAGWLGWRATSEGKGCVCRT